MSSQLLVCLEFLYAVLFASILGPTVLQTVALCYHTIVLSCLSVYDVGVLWPNGCMDQDDTWGGGRPQPRPLCARWEPSSPQKGHSPQFAAHVCCGQTAGWIKMPLGMAVGLDPGDTAPPPIFGPCLVASRSPISATAEHLLSKSAET